ncbi:MAG: glycosyltransferase family 1 protein [Candidatus Shapirobacteria bacterium]
MKKIVFDARMYGLEHAGIGRYIKNLLFQFSKIKPEFEFHLLVSAQRKKAVVYELGDYFTYHALKSGHYSFGEQSEVRKILKRINPDMVHFPHFNAPFFYSGQHIVTIHDLIKHYFRGKATTTRSAYGYWPKYLSYRLLVREVIKRSKAIIVPTHWWKKKLIQSYKLNEKKVFVTHEGIDQAFLKKDHFSAEKKELIFKKYKLKKNNYFIYTGSLYPHKNLERLIKAFLSLNKKNLTLVLVSARCVFSERLEKTIKSFGADKQIKLLGFVPDNDLKILYSGSIALVQPSLMEGFWLAGLEAMASNCPVVCSEASCLPEVYQKAVSYFNPLEISDIARALKEVAEDSALRKKLLASGKKLIKIYSWEKTAKQTIDIYRKFI